MDKFIRITFALLSWVIILFALATIGLRVGLTNIDSFKTEIESWLARDVIPGTRFAGLRGDWKQFNPVLYLTSASISTPDNSQTLVIDKIVVEFDYFRSLWYWSPVVSEVTGVLAKMSVRKDLAGQWWLNDIPLSFTSSNETLSSFEELVGQMPRYIQLELDQLVIDDQGSKQSYRIDQVRAELQRRENSIHWQMSANLPEVLGNRLNIKSIIRQESGVVYLKSDSLELTRIADLLDIKAGRLNSANMSGELWINLLDNRTPVLNGRVSITRGLWNTGPEDKPLPFALDARVNVSRIDDEWNLGAYFEGLSINEQVLNGFNTQVRLTSSDDQTLVQGWLEDLELHDLVLVREQLLPVEIGELVEQSQLQGRLKEAWFSIDPADINNLELSAEITDLSSRPVSVFPGMDGVNARFTLGRKNALVQLNSDQMALDFADQFREPFQFDQMQIRAYASLVEKGLVISAPSFAAGNADIKVTGRIRLEIDQAGAPFLYLRAQFEEGRGSRNGKYLPIKILPKKVVAWLDQGIRKVDISAGEVLFHGRVDSIKSFEVQKSGEMVVDFDIDNAEVLFDPKWAPAREAGGRVMFHNSSMEITVDRVKFEQIDSGKGRISIANLRKAVVEIDIETSTTTEKGLDTWLSVPLGRKHAFIGDYLRDIRGGVRANIDLSIPVNKKIAGNKVDVELKFDKAAFKAPAWGVELSDINGVVRVTGNGVSAKGVNALYFQDPVVVDISNTAENRQTIVLANGLIDSRKVFSRLPDSLVQGVEGRSPWQIRLAIANRRQNQRQPAVRIRATSGLENTAVLFPEPFNKKPEVLRNLSAELIIFGIDEIDINARYGPDIKMRGRLHTDNRGGYKLAAMDIGFSTPLKDPVARGFRIYGSLPKLPLDEWIVWRKSIIASQSDDAPRLTDLLEMVDLKIQSTLFFGNDNLNTDFYLNRTPLGFSGTVESSLITGNFDIPLSYSAENPITVDLEYIKLRSQGSQSKSTGVLPSDLFDIELRSKVFKYNDVLFSDLILDAHLETDTLVIDSMTLRHNNLALNLDANWQYTPGINEHFTTARISISGKEFGQAISSLDFGDIMLDGEADIEGRVGWAGELLNLDWGSLIGEARFKVLNGVLKDVDPGSGRLVGLLSLNALPRRLMLDFEDVFVDGLQFDKLTGTFKIDQGNLYTEDTLMDGPSARIKISGRTGLLDRDYDQTMIVVPKIRQTLPVIGGLAAGNTVGWALLLLQKLFKKQIDRSVEIEYRVTGTWEEPVLDLVRKFKEDKPTENIEDGNTEGGIK